MTTRPKVWALAGSLAVIFMLAFVPASLATGFRILLLHSKSNVSEIRNELSFFPGVAAVDEFDGRTLAPTIATLTAYDAVIVANRNAFGDPVATGNALADYVDQGGHVVLTVASFVNTFDIRGRFGDGGYMPFFSGNAYPAAGSALGTFDSAHPIMRGVTGAAAPTLLGDVNFVASNAEVVARWASGLPFVATNSRVNAVNVFVAGPGCWTGDMPRVLYNAAIWRGDAVVATGDPDISIRGEQVVLESTQTFTMTSAQTSHLLPIDIPPPDGGTMELIVFGNYGFPGRIASLSVEGIELGTAGQNGVDCQSANAFFPVGPSQLAALASDGVVAVQVQNSTSVAMYCGMNRHKVRLRYAMPSDRIDFGPVQTGGSRSRRFTIRNAGTGMLHVSSIQSDNPTFALEESSVSVPPLTDHTVTVTYVPAAQGAQQGTVTIMSDDPDESSLMIRLTGQGVADPTLDAPGASDPLIPLLFPNAPNPFRAGRPTTIAYRLPRASSVDLSIYSAAGRLISTLVEGPQPAGVHQVTWDGHDREGRMPGAGTYFVRMRTASFKGSRAIILLN